jgi:hypothetical protein
MREVLYNILNESGTPTTLHTLFQMCLNNTCCKVRLDKDLSGAFSFKIGLKQADALSTLLLKFGLEQAFRKVQQNHDMELKGMYQL